MKILIDGMGGDNAPDEIVAGAIAAAKEIKDDIMIIGKEDIITKSIEKHGYYGSQITVIAAEEVISNDEAPVKAVRTKKESSIVKGLSMVKKAKRTYFFRRAVQARF